MSRIQQLPFSKTILYEDEDYLIVNKPPLISTLGERDPSQESMLLRSRKYHPTAQVCHRLDKGTSGLLVFAKRPQAYKYLATQFASKQVKKTYHAVVEGLHTFKNTLVEARITMKEGSNKAFIDPKRGKAAFTRFTTHTYFRRHTLLVCTPKTGKTHQIRLHASSQGAPLVGDLLYGGHMCYLSELKQDYRASMRKEEPPLISRVALHALSLSFTKSDQSKINVEAPYPKDFKALITQLSKYT